MGFRSDDSGPAFEVSLFEEVLGVLAGVFDLVEIGLSDGEWTVRGITVCESWMSFSNFINDMGKCPPGMSIDRIDNNGNYCPENCRWADRKTQNRNTRRNVFIEINGEALCMLDAAKAAGLKMHVVRSRLRLGWSKRQAIGLDPPPLRGTERWVTVQGETMRLNQACRKFGISHQSFKAGIGRGWSIVAAIVTGKQIGRAHV